MVSRRREAFPSLSSMFAISSFHDGNLHTVHSVRDGTQFSKRLDFENAQTVRGVEILRHRAGLLCRVTKVVKQYYDLNFFVCNYWGVGKVLIHYTFLNPPPPPPNIINVRSLMFRQMMKLIGGRHWGWSPFKILDDIFSSIEIQEICSH